MQSRLGLGRPPPPAPRTQPSLLGAAAGPESPRPCSEAQETGGWLGHNAWPPRRQYGHCTTGAVVLDDELASSAKDPTAWCMRPQAEGGTCCPCAGHKRHTHFLAGTRQSLLAASSSLAACCSCVLPAQAGSWSLKSTNSFWGTGVVCCISGLQGQAAAASSLSTRASASRLGCVIQHTPFLDRRKGVADVLCLGVPHPQAVNAPGGSPVWDELRPSSTTPGSQAS